jgi:Uma2 family endonuclease
MEITDLGQLDMTKSYSYFDYLGWRFQERVELFKGKIYRMSPAPASRHQRISAQLGFALQKHLELKNCEVFYAPFDVRLERIADDKLVKTVVQPDICVICDETKIDERGCLGAPELIIEILSPGNSKKEMKNKFELYQEAGVLEYWIVDPEKEVIWQYTSENGSFVNHRPLIEDDILYSTAIVGFEMDLKKLF